MLCSAVYCCYCVTIILLMLWRPRTALGSCKNLDVVIVIFNLRRGSSYLIEAQKAPKIMPNEICRSLFWVRWDLVYQRADDPLCWPLEIGSTWKKKISLRRWQKSLTYNTAVPEYLSSGVKNRAPTVFMLEWFIT